MVWMCGRICVLAAHIEYVFIHTIHETLYEYIWVQSPKKIASQWKKPRMKNRAHVRRAINFTITILLLLLLVLHLLFFLTQFELASVLFEINVRLIFLSVRFYFQVSLNIAVEIIFLVAYFVFTIVFIRMLKIIIANCFSTHLNNINLYIHFISMEKFTGMREKGEEVKKIILSAFTSNHIIVHRPKTNDLIEYTPI